MNRKKWVITHGFSCDQKNTIDVTYVDMMLFHGETLYPNESQWKIPEDVRPLFLRRNIRYIPPVSLPTTSSMVVHKDVLESIRMGGFAVKVKPVWITKPLSIDYDPLNTQWTRKFDKFENSDDASDCWVNFPSVRQTKACKEDCFAIFGGDIPDPKPESFEGRATVSATLRDAIVNGTEEDIALPVDELEQYDFLAVDCYAMISQPLYELLKPHLYPRFFRVCEVEFE
jgi:hypothetical protein